MFPYEHPRYNFGAMSEDETARALSVQIALAEFAALRDEIANRSSGQNTLLNLNLTAIGGIGGVVLSGKAHLLLLLLLPILSPALGLLYFDHAINIKNIGNYIRDCLKKTLVTAAGDVELMRYEEIVSQYERRRILRFLPFGLPLFLTFAAVPIACLAATFWAVDIRGGWIWGLWATGLIMTVAYLVFWQFFLRLPSHASG
ncbi:MAG TPA: hypothetical protein VN948_20355 [Terriglobales bacterium]|nr:hypothetical protein [Terriglobales bacterium]